MDISDTIQDMEQTYSVIKQGVPAGITDTKKYVSHVNEQYAGFAKNPTLEDLFSTEEIIAPTITMTIPLEPGFDAKKVKESLDARLNVSPSKNDGELGIAETENKFSYGRYDFEYDSSEGVLKITHDYSDKEDKRAAVLKIMGKMTQWANAYLVEAQKYAKAGEPLALKPEEPDKKKE